MESARQSGAATALSKRRGGVERHSGVVVEGMVRGLGNADAFEKRCRAALATAVQNDSSEFIDNYAIPSRSSDSPHVGSCNDEFASPA